MAEFDLPHHHGQQKHLKYIHRELENPQHFLTVSEIFRQLSDPTRVRIFWLLSHEEQCVINIAAMLGMSSPAVSHHLRNLTESGILVSRREGKEVYYKAAPTPEIDLLHQIVERVMEITCPERVVDFQGSQEDVMHQVHAYMMEHLSEHITIEQLSREFLMNTTTLKQAFKRVYGTTIASHMKRHRMERAAQLLRETRMPVSGIAREVGYESQSRFSAAFRETYGMLPTEYRRGGAGGLPDGGEDGVSLG